MGKRTPLIGPNKTVLLSFFLWINATIKTTRVKTKTLIAIAAIAFIEPIAD